MSGLSLLYGVFMLFVAADAIASTLAAWCIFRLRHDLGRYIARALTGVAADATVAILTMFATPAPQRIIIWAMILRIAARVYKSYEMARLALHLHGYINGDHPRVMKDDPK